MEIQWEEPPARALDAAKRQGRYSELASALREHPGRWAVLTSPDGKERTEKGAAATAQNIKRGVMKAFEPKGAFDAVVDGPKVWVRFVEKSDEDNDNDDDAPAIEVSAKPAEVREWAQSEGLAVPKRGRLPDDILRKYAEAVEGGEVGLPVKSVKLVEW